MTRTTIKKAIDANPEFKRLVLQAAKFIELHPKHLRMYGWLDEAGTGPYCSATCNTTACLVGWVSALGQKDVPQAQRLRPSEYFRWKLFAEDPLAGHQAMALAGSLLWAKLVTAQSWPVKFRKPYQANAPEFTDATPAMEKRAALIAARRLRHWVRTGE